MTSKQLGSLLRKAPPATALDEPTDVLTIRPGPTTSASAAEVPLQVKIPAPIHKQLQLMAVERGESLRTLVLRGVQSLGVDVPDGELQSRRGRRPHQQDHAARKS